MARPKLASSDQNLFVWGVLRLYEIAASLQLAVILLFGMALTLGIATAVEAAFNTNVVQFYVYQSWWFSLLYVLLAINIFCAAAIRFPWKRHQTGFVITHIGLLVLLFSGVVSRVWRIDSQVSVWENNVSDIRAFEPDHYRFALRIDRQIGSPLDPAESVEVDIPFKPGPFSWDDYQEGFQNIEVAKPEVANLFSPLFYLASRNHKGDVVYADGDIKLEVLDYYGDSHWEDGIPSVEMRLSMPAGRKMDANGQMVAGDMQWVPVKLGVHEVDGDTQYKFGVGDRQPMGAGAFTMAIAPDRAATVAFLEGGPKGEIGEKGQAVLFAGGKRFEINIAEAIDKDPTPLEGTPYAYEVISFMPSAVPSRKPNGGILWGDGEQSEVPQNPTVRIELTKDGKPYDELVLLADMPNFNAQAYDAEVYGSYWFNHGERDAAQLLQASGPGGSRIDVIQGVDKDGETKRLFYRYWNRKEVVASGELPLGGGKEEAVDAFKMPIAQLKMYVESYVPADKPSSTAVRDPFNPKMQMPTPAALVRLTKGDMSDEFWIQAHFGDPNAGHVDESTKHVMKVGDTTLTLAMPIESYDIGFRIFLEKFERRLDPGTAQPSHYSSDVHYVDRVRDRWLMIWDPATSSTKRVEFPLTIDSNSPSDIASGDGQIYWVDNGSPAAIWSMPIAALESGDFEQAKKIIPFGLNNPQQIACDAKGGKLYWTDWRKGRSGDEGVIRSANLDGSAPGSVMTFAGRPSGIAIDNERNWIYYTNDASGYVGRMHLDGTELTPDWVAIPEGRATDVVVDPATGNVYWTDQAKNVIRGATTDGSMLDKAPFLGSAGKGMPNSLAISDDYLYWTDIQPNPSDPTSRKHLSDPTFDRTKPREVLTRVRRIKLDGEGNDEDVATEMVKAPRGAALVDGKLMWTQSAVIKENVWITMNAPDAFRDPTYRRDLHVFQESFQGPFKPGSPQYAQFSKTERNDEEIYASVFTVNHDPGSALRYWGCLLVILGIATMFYMRAYFFKPRKREESPVDSRRPNAAETKLTDMVGKS
ncbi:cytochrome c biogenesis protein ResB [Blastopirellula sp. JC732]|uniref:Cytochrome c biogenesis protein ResB n=1 Tax=Blastopirellula sediminis TaxID=2894196 RepID=A0A9X1MQY7_9BACT|nr:cytochrome c biogenesis protein ResB [Blastopirellula sediminis]MCC9604952.1 cytochrome c biogenesis protein ResB [Blastopirellula sediminis]MCC9631748.1 cytochrome c biogenesis protein ResB [Blastopirellula sediminis]